MSEIEYNDKGQKDGQLREYYKTGELKTIEYYKNDELIDTTKGFNKKGKLTVKRYQENGKSIFERYHENGKPLSRGEMIDTIAVGWWDYYDQKGKLYRKVEYIDASGDSIVKNVQHPNQIISYDQGKITRDSSNYFKIDLKDTVPMKKLTIGYLDLVPQISKESDFHWVYFWYEDKSGNASKIDTTYGKSDKKAKFWLFPESKGEIKLKGIIVEEGTENRINDKDTTLVDIVKRTKRLFFEKDVYVIEN